MEDKNCELLFQYLKSILYDPSVQPLDISSLDEPYQKLGMGLQYLEKSVQEMKEYSAELSTGVLSGFIPPRDNFLCSNLKNIHANLNHLTWQAKQVAKGDYSQTVSYLGEFSEAFNTMTRQLREREDSLKRESEIQKKHASMMESYSQLLMELINRSKEDILVLRAHDLTVLYCSQKDDSAIQNYEIHKLCVEQTKSHSGQYFSVEDSYEWNWEAEDSSHRFYKVTSGRMKWQGESAYTHIIHEITNEKKREKLLKAEAYQDKLTKIGNRYFFQEKANELLSSNEKLVFCYCDLDHLKYINDEYGHLEGDWYLTLFADIVKRSIRKEDIFARLGGDEFCIILKKCPKAMAEQKMQQILSSFTGDKSREYEKSFSYGIVEIPEDHPENIQVNDIIQKADTLMYLQKRSHYQKIHKNSGENEC